MISTLLSSIRKSIREIIIAFLVILFLLSCIQFLHTSRGIPYENLTRDINAIALFPKYMGFISQIGILIWSGSTVVCFFAYFIIRKNKSISVLSKFFAFFGFFSLILGLDDAFLLHEELAHRGLYEQVFYLVYAVMLILFIFNFWKLFFTTKFVLLGLAGMFLSLSILADQLYGSNYLLDDSFKISGIIFWFMYFFTTSFNFVSKMIVVDK
jgi:hypothetical protein